MTDPKPFLRWVGGSQRTVPELLLRLPSIARGLRYVDPFLGGGALFWALRPGRALLSDACEPLIRAWRAVRDPDTLIRRLEDLQRGRATEVLEWWYRDLVERINHPRDLSALDALQVGFGERYTDLSVGAILIALNRSAFNGLWRVNRQGRYNVALDPASGDCDLVRADLLRACSEVLARCDVTMVARSWEATVADAGTGDLVYADSPYDAEQVEDVQPSLLGGPPAVEGHRYTAQGWTRGDLVRLADALAGARARGAFVIATNAATTFAVDIYARRGFRCDVVQTTRSVSCDAGTRGTVGELIAVGVP